MEVHTKNRKRISVSTIMPDSEAGSLRLNERRLLRVLEAASIIPWEADYQTWRFTYVGSQAEGILGYPIDRWYENDFWTSAIFPEDQEFAMEFCLTSAKTLSDFEFQYRMKRADGEVIWLHDIVNVEMDDGVPQRLRGFMIDITAIKRLEETLRIEHDLLLETLGKQGEELTRTTQRSEQAKLALRTAENEKAQAIHSTQRLRDFLEAAPDATIIADEAGGIVFASSRLQDLFGYRQDEIVGSEFETLLPKRLRRQHRGHVDKFLQNPRAREMGSGLELAALHKDGCEFPVEVSLNPVHTGNHILVSCAIRDITSRKALQLSAERRAVKLAEANKALVVTEGELRSKQESLRVVTSKLIAAQEDECRRIGRELHDDLTQQLAVLAIDVSKLEQQAEATEGRDRVRLQKIKESLVELSEYVHTLSRQLHPAIVEDLGIAAALRSLCEEFEQNEGILIDCEVDDVAVDIPNDHALCVYRVAQEALKNVVKHSRATQAQAQLHSNKGTLQFQVRDNGIGFNLDKAKKQIGLGLKSIEERVWHVGGTVRVKTGPGDGTVISVSIPLS